MDTSLMTHLMKEFFPDYNLNERTGFPSSLSVPNVDAAKQIVTDILCHDLFIEFVLLLLRLQDEGWKGRKISISYLRDIVKSLYNLGYLYHKEDRAFIENPKIRKSRNWGILKERNEYNFTFLRIDIEGSSKLVRKHDKDKISAVYKSLRAIVQKAVETRTGRIWSWEGDGGLACFYYGNKNYHATLAAIEILHEIFFFNRLRNPISQEIRVRIAVHSGRCEYLTEDEELKKAEPVRRIMEAEKLYTPSNHITISVVVKEMLDSLLANRFKPLTSAANGYYGYTLELSK